MSDNKLSPSPVVDMESGSLPPVGPYIGKGFGPVLQNRFFRRLWFGQILAQTSQYGIHFAQMVLIEKITGSSTQMGLMIIAFSLPGLFFSPVSGIIADRLPKKYILLGSNIARALFVLSYLYLLAHWTGTHLLLAIYTITFVMAIISQFYAPAESATIPLLVKDRQLMTANSLFSMTSSLAQVMGMIILAPIIIKIFGLSATFVFIAMFYMVAAYAVGRIPASHTGKQNLKDALYSFQSGWAETWQEVKDGWRFVARTRVVLLGVVYMSTMSALVMILGMLAPGFAVRVLGLRPEDSVLVFAPAGVGLLVMTLIMGRFGHNLPRAKTNGISMLIIGLSFASFGWLARVLTGFPLLVSVAAVSTTLGMSMSAVSIVGQTMLQEESPPALHGRVFAVRFMMNNLIGLPPMLLIGIMADLWGIPAIMFGIGVVLMLFAIFTLYDLHRRPLVTKERNGQE